MATKKEKIIKIRFYILSSIGILILIGLFALGFLLDIYGTEFETLPRHNLIIFGGCVALSFIYTIYYMKYAVRHDDVLTKKKLK